MGRVNTPTRKVLIIFIMFLQDNELWSLYRRIEKSLKDTEELETKDSSEVVDLELNLQIILNDVENYNMVIAGQEREEEHLISDKEYRVRFPSKMAYQPWDAAEVLVINSRFEDLRSMQKTIITEVIERNGKPIVG